MITSVSCNACGRAQNAPTSRAGQDVACRFCGDSIRVPGSAAPQSAIGGWRDVEPRASPLGVQIEEGFGSSAQPELVERTSETTTTEWTTTLDSSQAASERHFSSRVSSEAEGVYESSSRTEVGPDGEVRTTRSESGRGLEGQPYQARYESVRGPDGQFSESSHESGSRPEFAAEFAGAPIFDRARQRPADAGPPSVGAPVGAPVTTSRHAREAKAGRPVLSGPSTAKTASPLEAFLPGLTSDSQAEKTASIALVLAIAGWAFCFPVSLGAVYFAAQSKKHALAEGLAVPQLATIANVVAILNLAFVCLASLGNLS